MDATLVNPRFITGVDEALLEDLKRELAIVGGKPLSKTVVADGGFGEKIACYYGASGMKVLNYGIRKEFARTVMMQAKVVAGQQADSAADHGRYKNAR